MHVISGGMSAVFYPAGSFFGYFLFKESNVKKSTSINFYLLAGIDNVLFAGVGEPDSKACGVIDVF